MSGFAFSSPTAVSCALAVFSPSSSSSGAVGTVGCNTFIRFSALAPSNSTEAFSASSASCGLLRLSLLLSSFFSRSHSSRTERSLSFSSRANRLGVTCSIVRPKLCGWSANDVTAGDTRRVTGSTRRPSTYESKYIKKIQIKISPPKAIKEFRGARSIMIAVTLRIRSSMACM